MTTPTLFDAIVDTDTGEVVDRAPAVRAPGPMTVVDVAAQCRSVEVWAA